MPGLPLAGLKVVEFTHMVMGPAAGAILVELGAASVRVEPIGGDPTRRLGGSGAGYHPMYNRGKRSICLDLKHPDGVAAARALARGADILIENFRPGALDRLGLGYEALAADNPRLIYCSEKGFLPGPYAHRTALDEVAQMMSGLAYMTGPPGRPLRAGASVIDVGGGMFGVIAILAALEARHRTGRGTFVQSALFETAAYFVGQHMAQMAVTGVAARPMPVRVSAWSIYDVFTCADGEQLFIGVVSDAQWPVFCKALGLGDLLANADYATNAQRVAARDVLLPVVSAAVGALDKAAAIARFESTGLPFAPIARPEDLFDDPHLLASSGLAAVDIAPDKKTDLPVLPVEFDGRRTGGSLPLRGAGADTDAVLDSLGYDSARIAELRRSGAAA